MTSQIAQPTPISAPRPNLGVMTSQDLFASVNASFSKNSQPSTPSHTIQENDYSVPAPPPPSPKARGPRTDGPVANTSGGGGPSLTPTKRRGALKGDPLVP
ncbi:uncharacterized protein B0T23DRAFT_424641 [Neurospora hispaniola]|uniref:Uncharacterized protein n=1 Tax=Neurospora hispaniola TaxID=588809 RepID=A0AAJ0MVB9_9PEZI|nr:hypothetical protein B0T23DRAFT_424641 [Neurospora hispaniola]